MQIRRLLAIAALFACLATASRAQDPPPVIPSTTLPSGTSREAELEARVRQLEAMVSKLADQVQQMAPASAAGASPAKPMATAPGAAPAPPPPNAPGQSPPANPPASARFQTPATLDNKPSKTKFGPGFEIRTEDDEYILQFHNLTQIDYRGYQQGGQNPVHNTFGFPRQWFMFSGRLSKPFGYFVSLAQGFDALNALDIFGDISYDPRLQFRIGRMKTPFTYEFYVEPVQGLITPERSIFFNNFAQNRDVGVMANGRLFDNKFDYALGIYNGSRNGYVSLTDSKSMVAFINYRPFGGEENTLFENLNIGGSVFEGNASNLPQPTIMRTVVPIAGNSTIGVPFLAFNSNVRESGYRAFWDAHVAYFHNHLSLIAEYAGGQQRYAPANRLSDRTAVPVQSFYVQSGYFLTGETASSVGVTKPLHPFDPRKGWGGLGAIELTGRYAMLDIGPEIFSNGFVDRNLWTNRVGVLDLGVNWYLTQYVKVVANWEHAEFGSPVQFAPGGVTSNSPRRQLNSDLFWLRFQLYF